ncbi:hypothetical protein PM3016_5457 [Paenibacillus mucilaginosus 3016]|uniref:Uncharacterized protein n=1 Tax=Paenibacillus mucilaginosus 3016 TaxID=1116391 RepID=H6NDV8_9BACL|nr:hypothetical protein [Paenibacillus mucilaginosus]AFC32157.1 hypothetical protein PM3016_5457 [Paenibacillus mucilaginosus 3016]WFA20658.1 hypothetical protein ERY13_27165 [Paenibacillus mucilaginosus]
MKKKALMLMTVVAAVLSFSTSASAAYSKVFGPQDLQGVVYLEGGVSNPTSTKAYINFKLWQVTPSGDVLIRRDLLGLDAYSSAHFSESSVVSLPWGTYKYEIVAKDGVRASGVMGAR